MQFLQPWIIQIKHPVNGLPNVYPPQLKGKVFFGHFMPEMLCLEMFPKHNTHEYWISYDISNVSFTGGANPCCQTLQFLPYNCSGMGQSTFAYM